METGESQVLGSGVFDGKVINAKFSPDGKKIVIAGGFLHTKQQPLIIWDAQTGTEIKRFSGHSNTITSVEWSSDGKRIVSASYDTKAKLWDVETGECISTFAGNTDILRKSAMSHDGKRIVTGSEGKKVNIWNAQTGVLERSLEYMDEVGTIAISPDGSLIAAGGYNNQIIIWEIETGNEVWTLRGHLNNIFDLAFSPDGKYLASGSGDNTIRIWNVETGFEIDTLFGHESAVQSLAFSTDGNLLVSCSWDKTVRIWKSSDEQTGQYRLLHTLFGHNDVVYSIIISNDGRLVVSGSLDNSIRIWDVESSRELANLKTGTGFILGEVYSVAISPDDHFVIAGTNNNIIHKWEINVDETIQYKGSKAGLLSVPLSLSYTSDGTRILAGIGDGTARLYNADDLSEIACFVYFKGEDAETIATSRGGMSEEAEQAVSQIDGEWLTITPDGFYRGSPNADRFINVLINRRDLSSMDAYSDFFHRPDIVWARLTKQPDPEKPSFTIQQAANFTPPAITILSPQPGTTVTDGAVTVSVSVTDRNRPIEDIRILVNGVRIGSEELSAVTGTNGIVVREGGLSVTGSQRSVQFRVPVMLVERGINRIEVMAFNGISWGQSGYSGSVNVNWQPPAGVEVPLPDLWILAVGVNSYDNALTDRLPGLDNLNYCGSDAKELVRSLKAQEGRRYKTVHSYLVTDEGIEPTAANIREQLRFLERAGQRDVVLLFMAGHGISEEGRFYFLTKDAVMENDRVNPRYAISDQELKTVLDLPGRRLVFIDACQSGGMDINEFMYSLRRTNAYMLSAAEGDKPSYEDSSDRNFWRWDGHGVFSYSVIRGLDGMARPERNASISVLQLSGYVRNSVMELTSRRLYQQKPVQYSWGFSDFDFAR